MQANHFKTTGMNSRGAKAVLENRSGKLIRNVIASSSICPGSANASPKLNAVTPIVRIDRVRIAVNVPIPDGHPYPNNPAAIMMMILWIRLIAPMWATDARMTELLDRRGATRTLFKKPNSRSNITGSPAFRAPLNAVKTIRPAVIKFPYPMLCGKKPFGALLKSALNNINQMRGCMIPMIKDDGRLFICKNWRMLSASVSCIRSFPLMENFWRTFFGLEGERIVIVFGVI